MISRHLLQNHSTSEQPSEEEQKEFIGFLDRSKFSNWDFNSYALPGPLEQTLRKPDVMLRSMTLWVWKYRGKEITASESLCGLPWDSTDVAFPSMVGTVEDMLNLAFPGESESAADIWKWCNGTWVGAF